MKRFFETYKITLVLWVFCSGCVTVNNGTDENIPLDPAFVSRIKVDSLVAQGEQKTVLVISNQMCMPCVQEELKNISQLDSLNKTGMVVVGIFNSLRDYHIAFKDINGIKTTYFSRNEYKESDSTNGLTRQVRPVYFSLGHDTGVTDFFFPSVYDAAKTMEYLEQTLVVREVK